MKMPKPKPTQIIRHEIVLGRAEKEIVKDGLLAYQINKISTPLVALLSDVSAMGLILGGIATYYGFKFDVIPGAYETGLEMFNDFQIQLAAAREDLAAVRDDPFGALWDLIIPNTNFNPGGRIDPVTGEPVPYQYGPTPAPDIEPGSPRPY